MLQPSLNLSTRRRFERALIDGNHREQQRLSHELHDGLGQDLAGLAYLANAGVLPQDVISDAPLS
jgi:signal transduction histidine kinase